MGEERKAKYDQGRMNVRQELKEENKEQKGKTRSESI